MTKKTVIETIIRYGFITIIRTDRATAARVLLRNLTLGEQHFGNHNESSRGFESSGRSLQIFRRHGFLGTGTTIDSHSATMAMLAGAQFVISPIVD